MKEEPKLLTVREAAKRLGVHPNTLRRLVDRGVDVEVRITKGGKKHVEVWRTFKDGRQTLVETKPSK